MLVEIEVGYFAPQFNAEKFHICSVRNIYTDDKLYDNILQFFTGFGEVYKVYGIP